MLLLCCPRLQSRVYAGCTENYLGMSTHHNCLDIRCACTSIKQNVACNLCPCRQASREQQTASPHVCACRTHLYTFANSTGTLVWCVWEL